MPTIQVRVQLSPAELLRSAEQLELQELDEFVARLLVLKAERTAPHLSQSEASLLEVINRPSPINTRNRFNELNTKQRAEPLSQEEQAELTQLIDEMEDLDVKRVEALSELARLRGTSLRALMKKLRIRTPSYV